MKKLVSVIIIIAITIQLCIPYYSYAESEIKEVKDLIENEEKITNRVETENGKNDKGEEEKNKEDKIEIEQEIESDRIEENKAEQKEEIKEESNPIQSGEEVQNIETVEENIEDTNLEEEIEDNNTKEKVKLEEGIYKIVLATAPNQSLTVDGGRTSDGTNIHIWEYIGANQQKFQIKYDEEGYCEIIPIHSGKRLDVVGWGNEANVDQWSANGGNDNQKWTIQKSEKGNYHIISKRQNLYLDAYQSRTSNGTNIQVYEASGGNGQEFKLEKIGNKEDAPQKTVEEGTYKIVMATNVNQSLTVDGGRTNDGANVHLWEYVNAFQQQFNLVYDGNGYYEIIAVNSGKRLDVVGWGNEANVDQWENNGGVNNQKWQIKKSKAGNYHIISQRDNRYLDAYQSKIMNGTNIQVYEASGGKGQEFRIEKIDTKSERAVENGKYKISPKTNTNIVVEASASNWDNNGRIQIWQNYNVSAQKLKLEYVDGYYKISLEHSGKYLTVRDNQLVSGAEIVQNEWYDGDNQKWMIREKTPKAWEISLVSHPELSITIEGNIQNGSKLILHPTNHTANQTFYIESIAKYIVVVNAGHGGSETGCAHGWETIEKNVTLQIARRIRERLSVYPQIQVILTRDGDYDMDINTRSMMAWNSRADLYVSLHINDEASHTATGSEVFVPWYEGPKHYNSNMSYLARLIQDNLSYIGIRANRYGGTVKKNIDWEPRYQYLVNGQVERADYYQDIRDAMKGDREGRGTDLSLGMGIPTVLVEHCYMNSSDYNFLNASWKIDQIGDADANAIIRYFGL